MEVHALSETNVLASLYTSFELAVTDVGGERFSPSEQHGHEAPKIHSTFST
jgi:hypothetical protein